MNGSDADPAIIPHAVRDVFDTVLQADDREFLIRVSYMEIYNEEINDLLTLEGQKLQIHESLDRGVYVSGLREEIVNSAEQVFELLQLGEANIHFGCKNAFSSCSKLSLGRLEHSSRRKNRVGSTWSNACFEFVC